MKMLKKISVLLLVSFILVLALAGPVAAASKLPTYPGYPETSACPNRYCPYYPPLGGENSTIARLVKLYESKDLEPIPDPCFLNDNIRRYCYTDECMKDLNHQMWDAYWCTRFVYSFGRQFGI